MCTQGLNLFRVLAAALKPVLPRVTAQAEAFLAAPVAHWSDLDAPLLAHRIGSLRRRCSPASTPSRSKP